MNYPSAAGMLTESNISPFATSLNLVKSEIFTSLDQAMAYLESYSESDGFDSFRSFLEEIQQVRGTFKILDFRVGERLCEELSETGRIVHGQDATATLGVFTQTLVFLKQYIDFVVQGGVIASSLLIPGINLVRRERGAKPLPEAYFFLVNLRPKLSQPPQESHLKHIPYRRARQLYQLGLLGLMRNTSREGALQVMLRALLCLEKSSRGKASWPLWQAAAGALESLTQESFDLLPQRLALLGALDRQIKKIQDTEGESLNEKVSDWLLKELLYIVALADADTPLIEQIQLEYQIGVGIKEVQLASARRTLAGPDSDALSSLSRALQEELQGAKDLIGLLEGADNSPENFKDLLQSLLRLADILQIANLNTVEERARRLLQALRAAGLDSMHHHIADVADSIITIEQEVRGMAKGPHLYSSQVDSVSLDEARIAILSESMSVVTLIKRAIASYAEGDGDKLHVKNISKSLHDMSGAMIFLGNDELVSLLGQLEQFVTDGILASPEKPDEQKLEAFADAVTAIEYYLDSMSGKSTGASDALKLAHESTRILNT